MIENPIKYAKSFIDAGADLITFHYEASRDVIGDIEKIRKMLDELDCDLVSTEYMGETSPIEFICRKHRELGIQTTNKKNIRRGQACHECGRINSLHSREVPDEEMIEAARLDGAGDFYILRKIIIPCIKPTLATVAILAFQASWNSIEASNYYINNEALKSFSFYMSTLTATSGNANALVGQLSGNAVAGLGMQAAATLIMFLPNLVLFVILQSRVMNTMSHSGMK